MNGNNIRTIIRRHRRWTFLVCSCFTLFIRLVAAPQLQNEATASTSSQEQQTFHAQYLLNRVTNTIRPMPSNVRTPTVRMLSQQDPVERARYLTVVQRATSVTPSVPVSQNLQSEAAQRRLAILNRRKQFGVLQKVGVLISMD
jgi:hypothetical protein